MKIIISFILILFSISPSAAAAGKQYRKTQKVNFDGSDIDGQIRSPDGSFIHQKRGVDFVPLYKVKKQFDRGIRSSVEYLR